MQIGSATSVGLVRDNNEDALWHSDRIFVICDGMGGHQAGEVASELAVDIIKGYSFSQDQVVVDIEAVITQAHNSILSRATEPVYAGMGTTITLAVLSYNAQLKTYTVNFGHVGDSRAYLYRSTRLRQITNDHSVVGELLRTGGISEIEAHTHPHRHIVTQAVGVEEIMIETHSLPLFSGDQVLLCSDGLTDVIDDSTMAKVVAEMEPQAACDHLVTMANQQGGPDNVSVIIFAIP